MLKKKWNQIKNVNEKILIKLFKIGVAVQCMLCSMQVYALESTQAVQGTKKLLEDGSKVMLLLEAAVIIVLEIKTLIQWQVAEEPQTKKTHIKKAGEILLIGGLVLAANGVITAVLSYYQ